MLNVNDDGGAPTPPQVVLEPICVGCPGLMVWFQLRLTALTWTPAWVQVAGQSGWMTIWVTR